MKHYATTDHKEYFAEATEAYFYKNDSHPFVRAELELHDPLGYAEIKRVWEPAEKTASQFRSRRLLSRSPFARS